MGFQPWVPQQDSNWEIRVTVLLSLLLQALLIFLGPTRKRSSNRLLHFAVWSCYLLADWVADLSLGLLLNNMGNIGGGGGSSSPIIFAFWTPFLLLHLGGPDTITAYSLEDNDLWLRHLVGLLFELSSAVVIIICSVHGNPMIPATVLIFVAGVIKYGERTYSLYCSSIENFHANILGPPNPTGQVVQIAIANRGADRVQDAVERGDFTRQVWTSDISIEARAYNFFCIFRRLFVDLVLSYQERRMVQAFMLNRTGEVWLHHPSGSISTKVREVINIIELELNFVYDMMYTKAPVAHTRPGMVLRLICSGCIFSALVVFFRHDKGGIKPVDVGITYALLLGGLALDVAALAMLLFSDRAAVFLKGSRWFKWLHRLTRRADRLWRPRRWSETVSQLNLIHYCLGKTGHFKGRYLLLVAKMLRVEEILEDFIFIRHVPLRFMDARIAIYHTYYDLGMKAILGERGEIMEYCNSRGERAVREFVTRTNEDELGEVMLNSVKRDFDESLLLWHIATNLCAFPESVDGEDRFMEQAFMLSDYMLYLLVKQSEIVTAKTGMWLVRYQDTCAEVRRFFGSMSAQKPDRKAAWQMLLSVNTSEKPALVKGDRSKSVLFDACILAKALRKINSKFERWRLVAHVWREMLTYTASKCRGTTHLRQLNRGGELITILWFLMENMGLGDTYDVPGGEGES